LSGNLTATIEILLHYNLEMGIAACKRLVILMSASRFSSNAQPETAPFVNTITRMQIVLHVRIRALNV